MKRSEWDDRKVYLEKLVLNHIKLNREVDDEELQLAISEVVNKESKKQYFSLELRNQLIKDLFDSLRRLDVITDLIDNHEITEIMVNGPGDIYIEKEGLLMKTEKAFSSKRKLEDIIQKIASNVNRRVNEASPIVDARLSDGSRVNIVLEPVALNGPVVTIRRFPEEPLTMNQLIQMEAITREAAEFLKNLVVSGYNIFISGGTGSGKTTFLSALTGYIPENERVITIEDSSELRLPWIKNLVQLETREANVEGNNEITIRQLIKTALRMRPERRKVKK
ncbi:MAG: CpaF family protein [Lachnospiraceae bacterium]